MKNKRKMRKRTKFWITFFILFPIAVAVFFIGWTQLSVPAGSYAVLVTKTGGVKKKALEPGKFFWNWERLIPTNVSLRKFKLLPYEYEDYMEGVLPSGDIYAQMLEGTPDFSYEVSVKTTIKMKSESLSEFVEKTDSRKQVELDEYLDKQSKAIIKDVVQYLVKESIRINGAEAFYSDAETIKKAIQADKKYKWLEISEIEVEAIHLPDIEMYNLAKETYTAFQAQVKKAIVQISTNQSLYTAEDYIQLERFARWGKILTQYPILIDFLQYSDDKNLNIFKK